MPRLAFAHSTKAAGSTVDLVLWKMAHAVQATLLIRPANFNEIRVRAPCACCVSVREAAVKVHRV